jgi:hypothetical protein
MSQDQTLTLVLTASEQPSDAEIKEGEGEAAAAVRNFAIGCLVLYFSKFELEDVKANH